MKNYKKFCHLVRLYQRKMRAYKRAEYELLDFPDLMHHITSLLDEALAAFNEAQALCGNKDADLTALAGYQQANKPCDYESGAWIWKQINPKLPRMGSTKWWRLKAKARKQFIRI